MPRLTSLSIFFPCYNDAGTIATMVIRAAQVAPTLTDDYEIIVINDGSVDDAAQVLAELKRSFPQLRVVQHAAPSGYGGVVRAGLAAARKEWVFYTDGDAQYNPRELPQLVAALQPGVDMVNGYKTQRRDPLHRVLIGRLYQHGVRLAFGLCIRDVDCDFRLMRRSMFDTLSLESTSGAITLELVKKVQDAGFKIVEVPVAHWPRAYGQSQFFSFARVAHTLLALARWWWRLVVKKEHRRTAQSTV